MILFQQDIVFSRLTYKWTYRRISTKIFVCSDRPTADLPKFKSVAYILKITCWEEFAERWTNGQKYFFPNPDISICPEMLKTEKLNFEPLHYFPHIEKENMFINSFKKFWVHNKKEQIFHRVIVDWSIIKFKDFNYLISISLQTTSQIIYYFQWHPKSRYCFDYPLFAIRKN